MATIKKRAPVEIKPPMEFTPVSEIATTLAALLYGRPGTGKTTIAASFPKPMLLMDINDKGWDSVSNVEGIKVAQVSQWEQIEDIYWYLKSGKSGFKSVVLDQMTAAQKLAVDKGMRDEGKDDKDQITKRVWGMAAGNLNTWILNYRNLIDDGINVLFLAHDRRIGGDDDSDEDQIDPSVGPRMMPSVASTLNGAVKLIGNTFINEKITVVNKRKQREMQYGMRLGPHSYYITKVRTPVNIPAPTTIINPSYKDMISILEGSYGSSVRKKT